jgi:cytochrome c553
VKSILAGTAIVTLLGAVGVAQNPGSGGYTGLNQTWESCEEMHDSYVKRFVAAEGFGMSRLMTPHMRDISGVLDLGRTRYSVESIELIGLLQQPQPTVYMPARHDFGLKLSTGQRPPTTFETSALASFRSGRDLVSQDSPGALRCIGAVRAAAACLRCHEDKKTGDLLGAFTYRLKALPN